MTGIPGRPYGRGATSPGADESSSPAWFDDAVAQVPEHRDVIVEGARVHYRAWGEPDRPGLVLIHGAGGHSGWWDHIAPMLSAYRVLAPDLTGHGDSDHREAYDVHQWGREVAALIVTERLHGAALVGHSMGGRVAVTAAIDADSSVSGVVCIDSPLYPLPAHQKGPHRPRGPANVYPSVNSAVAHFRTVPPQDLLLPYIGRHIARHSLRQVDDGWTWKFDRSVFGRPPTLRQLLPRLTVPLAFLRSERGIVDAEMATLLTATVGGRLLLVELPAAGHHPMLDQPQVLITALRAVLTMWCGRHAPYPPRDGPDLPGGPRDHCL
jgi:pimeloyl-ACP methyl ester carboxylesterase